MASEDEVKKPPEEFSRIASEKRPSHIRLNKMEPKEADTIVEIKSGLESIYSQKGKRGVRESVVGPVAVVCLGLVVVALCVCFWAVKVPTLGPDGEAERRRRIEAEAEREYLERKKRYLARKEARSMKSKKSDDDENGNDNEAFDNVVEPDALSHYTTQTEVCDNSHR